jgi:CubicO group peptidase (beta-lactamase class C family)
MEELRKEQTGDTTVNYSLGYHLRNGMFGHDGAYGTDLSVNPTTGMVAIFMVQCPGPDQWPPRDLFPQNSDRRFQKGRPVIGIQLRIQIYVAFVLNTDEGRQSKFAAIVARGYARNRGPVEHLQAFGRARLVQRASQFHLHPRPR